MMVGGGALPFHPHFGLWLCQLCYKKIRTREPAMLKELETTGQITSEQQARLRVLQERLPHKQCQERAATRRHARRQIELIEEGDEEAIEKLEQKKTYLSKRHQANAAKGIKVTSTGSDRKMKGKKLYPEAFMKLLGRATCVWIEVYGRSTVMWPDLVALFGELIKREHHKYPNEKNFKFTADDQPRYYCYAYEKAVEPYLDPPTEKRGKTWKVKDSYEPKPLVPPSISGQKDEIPVLRQRALRKIGYKDVDPVPPQEQVDNKKKRGASNDDENRKNQARKRSKKSK